jgi:hypothetical protein
MAPRTTLLGGSLLRARPAPGNLCNVRCTGNHNQRNQRRAIQTSAGHNDAREDSWHTNGRCRVGMQLDRTQHPG